MSTTQQQEPKRGSGITRKISLFLWILFFLAIIGLPGYIYSVRVNAFGLFGGFPDLEEIENPKSSLASVMYFSDGKEMGKYFRENRNQVTFDELSPHLVDALTATEDVRFEDHSGIDFRAMVRVAKGIITNNNSAGGGSTLTMQTAKNLFDTRTKLEGPLAKKNKYFRYLIDKTKEMILAVILESNYSKKEIMALYLNTVEFGSNAYGIRAASETFFDKHPTDLNPQEAALLAGIVQAPSRLSPVNNPENATQRREIVLYQMKNYGYLSQEDYDSLRQTELELSYSVASHYRGSATYFRAQARNYLMEWCEENGYDLWGDGLRVYTTIDSRMQQYAEQAVEEHMKDLQKIFYDHLQGRSPWIDDDGKVIDGFLERVLQRTSRYKGLVKKYGKDSDSLNIVLNTPRKMKVFSWEGEIDTMLSPIDSMRYYKHFLHTGFMAMDPETGYIKAWVGGINFKYFQFDHVKQGIRQPGSTFKPILYAAALENGYSPCHIMEDAENSYAVPGGTWTPENSDRKFEGQRMTLRQAMGRSMNRIAAYVIDKIKPVTVVNKARMMGIKSDLAAVPSLSLGTSDISLYELVGAYSTFVNEGVWTEPFYISRIEDKNGNVLQSFVPRTKEAMSEENAYLMTYMLRGATEEQGGTGRGLGIDLLSDNEIGGKTGTTQNASDGWFVGVTKDLVAGVWVGGDDKPIHFRSWVLGQGARTAMPVYKRFMAKVYADPDLNITKGPFKRPTRRLSVNIDCAGYIDPLYIPEGMADSLITEPPLEEEEIFLP